MFLWIYHKHSCKMFVYETNKKIISLFFSQKQTKVMYIINTNNNMNQYRKHTFISEILKN
ncbi:hypothetical protein COM47_28390 [Bacillus wiedmannii]|nr:hypothetical protein COM47_28390 [Bacillus wiedmannii]